MGSQAGSSRLDTVLKLLLIAFVSLLAFSSGVYFGKQMSDSDYQLKTLENDFTKSKDEKTAETKDLDVKPEDALVDEEVADISEKYVKAEGAEKSTEKSPEKSAANGKAKAKETDVVVEDAPVAKKSAATAKIDLTEVQKVAARVAKNEVPAETAKEIKPIQSRQPSSLPKTVGSPISAAQYTVQVAAYPTENDAKSQAAVLVKKGFPAYPVAAEVKGKTWYRVSVGSFKSQKEATEYRTQLMKQADLKSAIVQRIDR